jgi:hypothetical protein
VIILILILIIILIPRQIIIPVTILTTNIISISISISIRIIIIYREKISRYLLRCFIITSLPMTLGWDLYYGARMTKARLDH